MIEKRLIDYSSEYIDYQKSLMDEEKSFTLEDLMILVGVFL